jgi:hypothetical protein
MRKAVRRYPFSTTRAHALHPRDVYLPLPAGRKVSAKHTALKISFFVLLATIIINLFTTFYLPRLTHRLPAVITPPTISITLQQPAHEGHVSIRRIGDTPATIVMAGDSLARGHGSGEVNGQLKTIGYYLTNQANVLQPGIAKYEVLPGLTEDWSSVSMTTGHIQTHMETLSQIPNLVLFLSFTNRDMQNFVMDAAKVHSSNRLGEFFAIAQMLNQDSKTYQHSLTGLRSTLTTLQDKREKVLGDKKASMQVVILGLPNESYSPTVKDVLHKYHISYDQFSYVINLFNLNNREAAIVGNKQDNGITYSFINLDKLRISEKTALEALSPDQFHPNEKGYELLADYIAQNVLIHDESHADFLAKK